MKKIYDNRLSVDESIELMISILICYPEINTVKTDPKSEEIVFSFLLKKALTEKEFLEVSHKLTESIEAFLFVQNMNSSTLRIKRQSYNNYSLIEVVRDFQTITQQELSLIIQLVNQNLAADLLTEQIQSIDIEDLAIQQEIIEDLIGRLQYQNQRDLIGFRESGKVMVFHKSSI